MFDNCYTCAKPSMGESIQLGAKLGLSLMLLPYSQSTMHCKFFHDYQVFKGKLCHNISTKNLIFSTYILCLGEGLSHIFVLR